MKKKKNPHFGLHTVCGPLEVSEKKMQMPFLWYQGVDCFLFVYAMVDVKNGSGVNEPSTGVPEGAMGKQSP